MRPTSAPEIFISYSSLDAEPVTRIAEALEGAGLTVWRDRDRVLGGDNYGPAIVQAIRECRVLTLMCSASSMRSRNVKQEIQLAWHYETPYLPLLLDDSIDQRFPEQVQYWLEGCQWIPVQVGGPDRWMPSVLQALRRIGLGKAQVAAATPTETPVSPIRPDQGLAGLRRAAGYTDQLWPVPAQSVQRGRSRGAMRDLGAAQPHVEHGHRLGSRVRLILESPIEGYLLLLDQGTSGTNYCLCPSRFAPDPRLPVGRSVFPQPTSTFDSFLVTGLPGREHLLAVLTDHPLGLDWMPRDPGTPARELTPDDVEELLDLLRGLPPNEWTALSTYFDVIG